MWNFKSTGRVKTVDSQNPNVQGNVETYRSLTQAEYDELSYEEKHSGIVYFITDGATDHIAASSIRYDNSGTHIASTSVQGAIDELNTTVDTLNNSLTQFITYRNVQTQVTIPANAIIYDQTLDIPAISGYKAFAIGGWYAQGGGYADSPFTRLNLNETTQKIEYAMMTRNSSQVTLTIRIKVLYIRSNWVDIPS